MYTAVLFDMDGVLIDSEPGYNHQDAVWFEKMGIPFGRDEIAAVTGSNERIIGQLIKSWHPELPFTAEELAAQYAENLFYSISHDVAELIPGVSEWIDALRAKGVKTAIGSSSTERMVMHVADKFKLTGRMDCIVTSNDVKLGKPHPDIYSRCAELLGVSPESCLVIEDSINGIRAGHAANMKVAAFTGTNRHGLDLSEADFSYPAFDKASFDELFRL